MAQQIARQRRPWAMAIVALTLGAPALLLWLGRFKISLWYFALEMLAAILCILVIGYCLLPLAQLPHIPPTAAVILARLPVSIAGFLHARRLNVTQTTVRPWYARWYVSLPAFPVIGVVLAAIIRTFLFQPFSMPSGSGIPNLLAGDYIFVSKIAYRFADPVRGDIVIFKKPPKGETDYVKRVIGLPGDRIQMKGGRLFLNGTLVERTPLVLPAEISSASPMNLHFYRETLPEGFSYAISEVSDHGLFDDTAEFVVPAGHYFMMGDNRDNSSDSRIQNSEGIGYVPRSSIIGRYSGRFWNSAGVSLTGRPK